MYLSLSPNRSTDDVRNITVMVLAAILTACGTPADTIETFPPTTTTSPPSDHDPDLTQLAHNIHTWQTAAWNQAVWNQAVWNQAVWRAELQRQAQQTTTITRPHTPTTTPTSPSRRCGGHLPPCWVLARESGGRYDAVNPTGCGGRGCYGAWQFDPRTWDAAAGRAGRPDLIGVRPDRASPEDQDLIAAALWDDGRGCSHWAAC